MLQLFSVFLGNHPAELDGYFVIAEVRFDTLTRIAEADLMRAERGPAFLLPATAHYPFEPGVIYNLDGDEFIREGGGPQGAHNDLARPEVAHLMWEAALASVNNN